MRKSLFSCILGISCLAAVALAPAAQAQSISLIRDTEIEHTIRTYAAPIFGAAGLSPEAVSIYIVNDRQLNAFVAGGQNIFLHTGLLMRAENPEQVIGVLAHETGHISGGHLAQLPDALRNASVQSILAFVLGAAAAVATGRPDAGIAIGLGGTHVAERNLLRFSRTQESAADQAALAFLERTGQSARGLLEFFDILGEQELLSAQRQDAYVRTHPLTRERVRIVENHVERSRYSDVPPSPEFVEMFERMHAKLHAFLDNPAQTLRTYPESDISVPARYARAIAHYRRADLDQALPLVEGLIAEHPDDPFFHELKGQMLFENGRAADAVAAYRQAVRLLPRSPLLRTYLAQAQLELNAPELADESLALLNEAVRLDPDLGLAWRLLAIAYGRDGQIGMAALALAEQAMLSGRYDDARQQAIRAERQLPSGTPGWLRAQDIQQAAQDAERLDRRSSRR